MKDLICLMLVIGAICGPLNAEAAGPEDPNWPCIQRKVPQLSSGMVWAGPSVEELEEDWRTDLQIKSLAQRIAARSLAIDEAKGLIELFASDLKGQKDQKLTLLFAATLATINGDRSSIINGIERYARRQKGLAERIQMQTSELNQLPQSGSAEDEERRRELEERQNWDMRIFEERERSLTYICEQPVILEQRLFTLSRKIMEYLD